MRYMSRAQRLSESRARELGFAKDPDQERFGERKTILDDFAPSAIIQTANVHRIALGGRLRLWGGVLGDSVKNKLHIFFAFGVLVFLFGCGGSITKGPGDSTFQLAVTSSGSGSGSITSSPAGVSCGTACVATFSAGAAVTLTAAPASNSTFTGWTGGCSGTSTCSVTMNSAVSVGATFTAAAATTYQLTVTPSGTGTGSITSTPAGINCGATCAAGFAAGTAVTLTATPAANSTFAGWTGACSGTSTCSVTMNAATTVGATFTAAAPVTYQLTVTASGTGTGTVTSSPAGINCGTACAAGYAAGTAVTLTAAPAPNSTFAGWTGACSGISTCSVTMNAATSVGATFTAAAPTTFPLTVTSSGTGTGSVTSSPAGISCGTTCTASYAAGTAVTLTAVPGTSTTFAGWTGGCTGTSTCSVTMSAATSVGATFTAVQGIQVISHVILLTQENRSLDSHLGQLRQYWAQNGVPDQSFDGLPQFNPTTGAAPLKGAAPSLPGCNPSDPAPSDCIWDPSSTVTSFHLSTVCTENTSPSWDEAHNDWFPGDNTGNKPALNNGFVYTAAYDARANDMFDSAGARAMGYYDGTDLNYLYFMATKFATSDRWFQPAMSRTNINREYLLGATSGGYAYPNGTNTQDTPQLSSKTIFEDLQNAGISWRIYVNPTGTGCSGPPYEASCLILSSYLENFGFAQTVVSQYPQNIQPISQYFTDVQNGTLAQVSYIAPASDAGLDEHGTDADTDDPTNVQTGEAYVESLINALMNSSSWSNSALFWTYDESGGLYDHVSPVQMPSPDGIKPVDLLAGDICETTTGGNPNTCDFTWTGYRIPLVVVSPYAKQNYVDHTAADFTAMLKFIETRWNLPALTKRDAAQPDMTEFFDFNNPPWATPPTPPTQNTSNPCYLDSVP
jgi:phospholipase C